MLHATAVGKAVASQLADETVLAMVNAAGMPQPTPSTLGSPTGLLRELHRIRGEGFAMSENERHSDVRGVAVPIGGETIALGVAGPGGSADPGPGRRARSANCAGRPWCWPASCAADGARLVRRPFAEQAGC